MYFSNLYFGVLESKHLQTLISSMVSQGSMSTRRGISLSTENFVCCSRNSIFSACKISRSFVDHPSRILITKVDKFYTALTINIQKNRRVRTAKQN